MAAERAVAAAFTGPSAWRGQPALAAAPIRPPTKGAAPFVRLQFQRRSPRGFSERVYDVVVEPGRASRAETARGALRSASALSHGRGSELSTPRCSPSLEGGGSLRRGRKPTDRSGARTAPLDERRRYVDWGPLPPRSASASGGRITHRVADVLPPRCISAAACPPSRLPNAGSCGSRSGSKNPWASRMALSGSEAEAGSLGPAPTTARDGSHWENSEVIVDDLASHEHLRSVCSDRSERGGDNSVGLSTHDHQGGKSGPHGHKKVAVRDLERRLEKSMVQSFSREVWQACEVPHPDFQEDDQGPRENADLPRSRKSMMEVLRGKLVENRAKHHIEFDMDVERYMKDVELGRQAVKLAQDTGWDVLDVEEVRDLFVSFAPSRSMNVASVAFTSLLKQLYTGSGTDEVMSICEEFAAQGVGKGGGDDSEDSSDDDNDSNMHDMNYEINFSDFFMALTTWLKRQDHATKGRRCTLRRFEVPALGSLSGVMSCIQEQEDSEQLLAF